MMRTVYLIAVSFALGLIGCVQQTTDKTFIESAVASPTLSAKVDRPLAKYEPEDGKVLVFIGQEITALGGLDEYNDGYLDHFEERPAGFTSYSFLTPGDTTFGFVHKGLDGIFSTDNWGDSVYNASLQLADPDYDNMMLAIGLGMVNHETKVANGEHDEMIIKLGEFIKSIAPRPVFLRVGYEFDGHLWNHYDKDDFIKAFRRVKDILDKEKVDNVAYVWQSAGFVSTPGQLEDWYPGDDYVDWCGFSFFARWREQEMIEFARKKGKPVFIAEASPTVSGPYMKFDNQTLPMDLHDEDQAQLAWNEWFVPFFETIEDNGDVVKAFSYINCDWKSHPMWFDNPTFKLIDARLHVNKGIKKKWEAKLQDKRYIMSSEDLYKKYTIK
ncbi:glycoside hydrolase family 26 protein [Flammeovirga sp. SJP92]|uniref:glycoside hydrolase family 26 protein n=1 Tax=Flammeovirga sp. SJP92 TaxID=1775430 RepID=UPI000B30F588|nr:glycosyl hydrolase [Flammeovirga sp. SJP92]